MNLLSIILVRVSVDPEIIQDKDMPGWDGMLVYLLNLAFFADLGGNNYDIYLTT